MASPSSHLYRERALALGRDPITIDRALEIDRAVISHGARPVLTLNHLAQLTGASWQYLRDIVARHRDPYFSIERPKRNGKTRAISSPEPVLMDVQRWILREILTACEVHRSSYAYQANLSIRHCAEAHLHARWLVKLDIHNFFGSVKESSLYPVFLGLGYSKLLSFEMSRLCTRAQPYDDPRKASGLPYPTADTGRLPQGAPTSGALANAVMLETDMELDDLASRWGLIYTRYSDDLIFSAGGDFSRERAIEVIRRIVPILEKGGFAPHHAKTRIVPPGARQVVLGLLLAEGRVCLMPEFKRRIEVHIRGVSKFGILNHVRHRRFRSVLAFINHIDGCIAFAESIDPTFGAATKATWNATLEANGYPTDS